MSEGYSVQSYGNVNEMLEKNPDVDPSNYTGLAFLQSLVGSNPPASTAVESAPVESTSVATQPVVMAETTDGNIEYLIKKLRDHSVLGNIFQDTNDLEMLKELNRILQQVEFLIEMLSGHPGLKGQFQGMNGIEMLQKLKGQLEQVGDVVEMSKYDRKLKGQFKGMDDIKIQNELKRQLHLVENLITTLGYPYQGMSDKMLQELKGQLQQGIEEIQAANLEAREAVEAKEARIAFEIAQRERRDKGLKKSCGMFGCSARGSRGGYKQRNKTQRRMKKRLKTKRLKTKRRLTKRRMTKRRMTKRRMTKRQTKRRTSR